MVNKTVGPAVALIVIIILALVAYVMIGHTSSNQQSQNNRPTSTVGYASISNSTASKTTVPQAAQNSGQATYYISAPTSIPYLLNLNGYSIVANYTISAHAGGLLGGSSESSGTLHFSNNQATGTQNMATLTVPAGNATMQIVFTSFKMRVNNYTYTVTPQTSTEMLSEQNVLLNASNKNYSLSVAVNYTNAKNLSYYYNASSGIYLCFNPGITAIAGSYFVILSNFTVNNPGKATCP